MQTHDITHDIIVIGASAGGVETLIELAHALPADLPAAVFIVLHLPPHGISALPNILSRAGKLPAIHPQNKETICNGTLYLAPPDQHMLLEPEHVLLTRGPRENRHRPAVDPLFRTAAKSYGQRVVGVVLSGALDDGTAGLMAVKACGGTAIVQDPDTALYAGMPSSAIENVNTDYVLSVVEIAALLTRLAHEPVGHRGENVMSDEINFESDMAEFDMTAIQNEGRPGTPSNLACPECGGTLWEVKDGRLIRFRCRVGHAFSIESLMDEQSSALEDALWTALRALEERVSLARRMADRSAQYGHTLTAQRMTEQAHNDDQRATLIRNALIHGLTKGQANIAETSSNTSGSETT